MSKYNIDRIKVLVTSACNSNCTHCFRSKDKNTEFLTEEKLKEIVDFGIENNCRYFSFSGGEFFTHPYAYGLIDYCLSKKAKVSILTNALDINIAYFSSNHYQEYVSFQISVDGLEEAHDRRRGIGSYKKTINNAKQLFDLGYTLTAKMAIDEQNYMDFINVLNLPWFSKLMVLPVALSSETLIKDCSLQQHDEYETVIDLIYKESLLINGDGFHCGSFPDELAIKYDGNIYPCTEAREHNEYVMGNILNKSLNEVIEQYELNNKHLPCRTISVYECNICDYNSICKQGCRLRAFRYYGDFSKPDPFTCRIFKKDFKDIPIGKLMWGEHN